MQRPGDGSQPTSAPGARRLSLSLTRDRRATALGALDATVPPALSPGAAASVLLIHDAPAARSALSLLLADEGFAVRAVSRNAALEDIAGFGAAIVLLQLVGPLEADLELLRLVRQRYDEPLIILSPHDSGSDKARALELGADDYLCTPFDPDELTARVRAVLRRSERHTSHVPPLIVGQLSIDFERRVLLREGNVVPLGRTEWLVLRHLARYSGRVVLNTELLRAIWGEGYSNDLQVLRICISRLRHKLGAGGRGAGPIRTFHNVGYALEID
jgi:DNA-binding response OmpR family regulator